MNSMGFFQEARYLSADFCRHIWARADSALRFMMAPPIEERRRKPH